MLEQKLRHGLPPLCTVGRAPPANYFRPPSGLKVSMQRELARTNSRHTVNILPIFSLWLLVFTSVWQHYAKSSTIWLFLSLFWNETSFIVVILPMMIRFGKKALGLSCSSRLLGNRHTTGELCAKIELISGGRALGGNPE
jgi:hypothetical protein